jgi:1-phosphatidylinositol-4-phosphate 5-kinase
LTGKYILSELYSPGKSGSLFYYSQDYRFIIKTIRRIEHRFLRQILTLYHGHIQEHRESLLVKFYGLHRVQLPQGDKIYFVVMGNIFSPSRPLRAIYDLKVSQAMTSATY